MVICETVPIIILNFIIFYIIGNKLEKSIYTQILILSLFNHYFKKSYTISPFSNNLKIRIKFKYYKLN